MSKIDSFNNNLLKFLKDSPTPFHAVSSMEKILVENEFILLDEAKSWTLDKGKKYFTKRNDSSLIAFKLGSGDLVKQGVRMIGAHTDSPCLKVKPNPDKHKHHYYQLGVEVYGGALLNPWFDRDLSIAGRVNYLDDQEQLKSAVIDFEDAVAIIPSLAIHLDRNANENRTINKQDHLSPILLSTDNDKKPEFHQILKEVLLRQKSSKSTVNKILDYDLFFYDTQAPAILGYHQDYIASARLDNLLSCYVGLSALVTDNGQQSCLLVCNDHEEVGSQSSHGAQGPFLKSVLQRITRDNESFIRCMNQSMMVSVDNAHGIHPNYADQHDENHGPILNRGPVIKINANQRYATNSETSAIFRHLCYQENVAIQSFVVRSDMACGSTIGPITAGEIGVKTIDVGVPTFAMHSIRELAGSQDAFSLFKVLKRFFCS